MKSKILSLSLLIGLSLPSTNGSEIAEVTTAEQTPLAYLVEKSTQTYAEIIEGDLLSYMYRHDKLTERDKQIECVLKLFLAHLRQSQQPSEGYDIILEDIRAHPDSEERARQLLQMEELIGLVNSGTLSPETLTLIKAKLDQRKQRDLDTRIDVIIQCIMQSQTAKKLNTDLLAQIKTTFENDLEKLRQYRDEEAVSKWSLESPLQSNPTASESTPETPLPILADVIRESVELAQASKEKEIEYLQENINLLSRSHDQLTAILDEAKALEETDERNEMIQALEKDIAGINGFIERERARLARFEL